MMCFSERFFFIANVEVEEFQTSYQAILQRRVDGASNLNLPLVWIGQLQMKIMENWNSGHANNNN